MLELILILIPFVYQFIMIFLNRKSAESALLERELVNNDIYIISDNFKYDQKKYLFLGIFYYLSSDLCYMQNVIDASNENNIKYFLNKIDENKNISIILDTSNNNDNTSLNLVNFLSKKNKIKINSYIPETTTGSSILLALSSEKIFMNRNSYISPLKNLIEFNPSESPYDLQDEKFGKYYRDYNDINYLLDKFFINKKELVKRIRNNFISTDYCNIYFDIKDLKKFGIPVELIKDQKINKIFNSFRRIKQNL